MLRRTIMLVIIILAVSPVRVMAKDCKAVFYEITILNDQVVAHMEVLNLLEPDVIRGLQKGMTAALEYQVQLWRTRSRWTDQLIMEKFHRMKLAWDPWSKRYTMESRESQPLLLSEEDLIRRCTLFETLRIVPLNQLEKGERYFIAIKIILKPMSVENMEDIGKWLSGEVREIDAKKVTQDPPTKKKAGNWLMGLVLNITGFGDRVVTGKSPLFVWREGDVDFDDARAR